MPRQIAILDVIAVSTGIGTAKIVFSVRILGVRRDRYGEPLGCSLPHSGVGEDRSEVGDEPKPANPGLDRLHTE